MIRKIQNLGYVKIVGTYKYYKIGKARDINYYWMIIIVIFTKGDTYVSRKCFSRKLTYPVVEWNESRKLYLHENWFENGEKFMTCLSRKLNEKKIRNCRKNFYFLHCQIVVIIAKTYIGYSQVIIII